MDYIANLLTWQLCGNCIPYTIHHSNSIRGLQYIIFPAIFHQLSISLHIHLLQYALP